MLLLNTKIPITKIVIVWQKAENSICVIDHDNGSLR